MITKEQFLAGVKFKTSKTMDNIHSYMNEAIIRHADFTGDFIHTANVVDVSDDGFSFYRWTLGVRCSGVLLFSDCTAIVNEPKEAIV